MTKKGENIYIRKDGRYEARYAKERDEKNRILKYGYVYGKNYKEVKIKRELALENLKEIRKKDNLLGQKIFSYEIIKWFDNKLNIKDSTYYNYHSIIFSRLIPFFSNIKLRSIDENLILKFIRNLQEDNLSGKRIKDVLIVLKQFLKYEYIDINFDYPKINKGAIISLTEDEITTIEEKVLNSTKIKDFSVWLVLYTGLRIGELCALQWKDIDLESQVISVSKTVVRVKNVGNDSKRTKVIIDSPKTETSIRVVPIHDELLPYLKKFKKDDNLFLLTESESFMPTNIYYHYYKKLLKTINVKNYNFHVLRHTFATRSLLNGIDIKTLSEILGHSSVKITLDRYVHINNSEKLNQINKLPFGTIKQSN